MVERREYLLGMAPDEVRRLEHQHDAWREPTRRLWTLAAIRPGETVVDLGCGPGFTAIELARLVGASGRVIAVDSSTAATEHLRDSLARLGVGNVEVVQGFEAELDLSSWRPDVVFARWLYWFLPEAGDSIRRVAASLGPGGRFVVMDYCNYHGIGTEPRSALFDRVFRAIYDSVADAGGSLDVAGRLPGLFGACGLRIAHLVPLAQIARPGEPVWQWVSAFQRLHLPALVRKGYLSADELAAHEHWWAQLERHPGALFFAPPMLGVVGIRDAAASTGPAGPASTGRNTS